MVEVCPATSTGWGTAAITGRAVRRMLSPCSENAALPGANGAPAGMDRIWTTLLDSNRRSAPVSSQGMLLSCSKSRMSSMGPGSTVRRVSERAMTSELRSRKPMDPNTEPRTTSLRDSSILTMLTRSTKKVSMSVTQSPYVRSQDGMSSSPPEARFFRLPAMA